MAPGTAPAGHRERVTDCDSLSELREFRAQVEQAASAVEARISKAFEAGDVSEAAAQTVRLQYHLKLLNEMQSQALKLS